MQLKWHDQSKMMTKYHGEQIGKACFKNQDIEVVRLRHRVWQNKSKSNCYLQKNVSTESVSKQWLEALR